MADTGAPYFIPYVEPTDLVRDYPAADEASADAIAAALGNIPVLAGIGSNVVQTVKTDVFSTTSASFVAVTGLSVSITPTSATSKIMLIANVSGAGSSTQCYLNLLRDATTLAVGDADGTRIQTAAQLGIAQLNSVLTAIIAVLDSPATTAAVTYSVHTRTQGAGTVRINRSDADQNGAVSGRSISSITAIEVAA